MDEKRDKEYADENATSCAVSAVSQLSPAVDWVDFDGNLLISNDFFKGTTVVNGKLVLSELPGVGITKLS